MKPVDRFTCQLLLALIGALIGYPSPGYSMDRPNILLICVDDLRPALGCYGDAIAITPSLDKLAEKSTLFSRAYCQQAVCSPSRLSLLTGLRPDTIRVWDLKTHFRAAVPDTVTLPQHFKNNGYHTESIGKIYHGSGTPSKDPPSWSQPPRFDQVREAELRYALENNLRGKGLKRSSTESAEVPDDAYVDGLVCHEALQAIRRLGLNSDPFFLAVGFRKPHLPFCAPKKYWDLYASEKFRLTTNTEHPQNAPELATRSWNELEGYQDIPKDRDLSAQEVAHLRHGYYACVSYIDALIGQMLDELSAVNLSQNTIVLVWGDHGYHLGEQGLWTKANNYELATRIPLIVHVPNLLSQGNQTRAIVELVDIYPTLAELCGLSLPHELEGYSFKPLLTSPNRPWKKAAFSQYPRAKNGSRHQTHGDIMGYALRTDRYRYVEWRDWESQGVVARELYDHLHDPSEQKNLAEVESLRTKVRSLSEQLSTGWRSALPDETP